MKVLHLNTYDSNGGAAKAAFRLHQALNHSGIDTFFLSRYRKAPLQGIESGTTEGFDKWHRFYSRLSRFPLLRYRHRGKLEFAPNWVPIDFLSQTITKIDPDIIHLHWICEGFFDLKKLARFQKPVVWSLHDMWPFTGGCHYTGDCDRFENECGSCPLLGNHQKDLSFKLLHQHRRIYQSVSNMTVVGLSKWMTEEAKNSSAFHGKRIECLPNPIQTALFKPMDSVDSRKKFNLPLDKKLVLFGGIDADSNPRKGFSQLVLALGSISAREDLEVVVLGGNTHREDLCGLKVHSIHTIADESKLVALYNAVDVVACPSLQENLSNVIMESLSCGTPVVAFKIGGNQDMIDHQKNGYLAELFDPQDFASGLNWVLTHRNCDEIRKNARQKVLDNFNFQVVSERYIDLYKSILSENLE